MPQTSTLASKLMTDMFRVKAEETIDKTPLLYQAAVFYIISTYYYTVEKQTPSNVCAGR